MTEIDQESLQEFSVEAYELLDEAEKSLLQLEKGAPFNDCYNSIFRVFHSLKGAAGMLNLEVLQEHMHKTENLFQDLKARGSIEKSEIDFFLKAADTARRIIRGEDVGPSEEAPSAVSGEGLNSDEKSEEKIEVMPASSVASAPGAVPGAIPKKGTAVVIDDEIDLVESLVMILQDFDLEVFGFTDPKKALEQIKNCKPTVVLTDLAMPGMTGIELLEQIRKESSELPVIFVTGQATKEALVKAISAGVFAVIEKPFANMTVGAMALQASEKYQVLKLLGKSINMVMYQFADIDDFLASQKREDERVLLRKEIEQLQRQYKSLTALTAS